MAHTTPKKHICIDARFYRKSTAGVGRYTRALIHNLQKLDSDFEYTAILTPEDYKEWPEDTTPPNWKVEVMDITHFTPGEQTALLSYLTKKNFDLVHFTQFNHPIFYKGRMVVTIHDLILFFFPTRPLWHPRSWAFRYTMWHAAHKANQVIVPSECSKNDLIQHLGANPKHITVTYEGVEEEFKPVTDEPRFEELRQRYHITKPFLFFVNAWRPHKGLPELVEAFLDIKKDHDIQILIGGKPNSSFPEVVAAVEKAKAKSPDILTPGFVDDADMVPLYNMAEAFMLPTHYEGFGIPGLEAMTCGCPVISAKNSSLEEVLGDAALYFETGNAKQLANRIDELLTTKNLPEDLRKKGAEQAKKFSFKKMAEETLAVYKKTLDS